MNGEIFNIESYKIRISIFLCILLLVLIAGMSSSLQPQLLVGFSVMKIVTLLSAFFVLALLLERCVEVLLGYLFGTKEAEISAPLIDALTNADVQTRMATKSLSMAETPEERVALLSNTLGQGLANSSQIVTEEAMKAHGELLKLKVPKYAVAILIGTLIGLAVSASGFRILTTLLYAFQASSGSPDSSILENQTLVFRCADLLVSSLVLAGGADGIHAMVKRIPGYESEFQKILRRSGINTPK